MIRMGVHDRKNMQAAPALALTNSNAHITCHFEMTNGFALLTLSSCQKAVVTSTKAA